MNYSVTKYCQCFFLQSLWTLIIWISSDVTFEWLVALRYGLLKTRNLFVLLSPSSSQYFLCIPLGSVNQRHSKAYSLFRSSLGGICSVGIESIGRIRCAGAQDQSSTGPIPDAWRIQSSVETQKEEERQGKTEEDAGKVSDAAGVWLEFLGNDLLPIFLDCSIGDRRKCEANDRNMRKSS